MKLGDRVKKLRKLANLSQAELAELSKLGIGASGATRISNYENNVREPSVQDVIQISKALSSRLGKVEAGWLQFGTGNTPGVLNIEQLDVANNSVYLLDWTEINDYLKDKPISFIGRKRVSALNENISEKAFALKIKDDSMRSIVISDESFYPNDIIVVDPEIKPGINDYVLIQHDEKPEPIIRQLVESEGEKYLKPANPQYQMFKLCPKSKILGTVVAKQKIFK